MSGDIDPASVLAWFNDEEQCSTSQIGIQTKRACLTAQTNLLPGTSHGDPQTKPKQNMHKTASAWSSGKCGTTLASFRAWHPALGQGLKHLERMSARMWDHIFNPC